MKLTVQILKIPERIIEKLTGKQVDIDEMQIDFVPGCGITDTSFILRHLQEKYLAKKEEVVLCICRFGESF